MINDKDLAKPKQLTDKERAEVKKAVAEAVPITPDELAAELAEILGFK